MHHVLNIILQRAYLYLVSRDGVVACVPSVLATKSPTRFRSSAEQFLEVAVRKSRDGLAVRVPSTLATKPPARVRMLVVAIFSRVNSKCSENRDGYSSAIKMPAVKSS